MSEESLQQFKEWKNLPITKSVFQYLINQRNAYREQLESEGLLYKDHYIENCAKLIGAIQTINMILSITPTETKEETKEKQENEKPDEEKQEGANE